MKMRGDNDISHATQLSLDAINERLLVLEQAAGITQATTPEEETPWDEEAEETTTTAKRRAR